MSTKPMTAPRKAPAKRRREPTEAESLAKMLPPGILMSKTPDGSARCMIDPNSTSDGFRSLGGSEQLTANMQLLNGVLAVLPAAPDVWTLACRVAGALALLQEMKPADGVEGMIAAQAVALHLMAMEAARRVVVGGQPAEATDRLRKSTANLMRAQIDMLAALDRKRGKVNHQTVRVERVLVTEGGALIGAGAPVPALGQGVAPMALAAIGAGEGAGA